jgi:hypothetical protein
MSSGKPPADDEAIRAELRKQGIDNFGQLVSAAARHIRQQGDVEAAWYFFVGEYWVFIVRDI